MKLSELISNLQSLLKEFGDLTVCVMQEHKPKTLEIHQIESEVTDVAAVKKDRIIIIGKELL